ncbi:MAG: HAD family hydrolase [Promethearchaeota archaeon]
MLPDIIGVYFDWFGTLVDSRYTLTNIWARIANRLGKKITSDDSRILEGMQKQVTEYFKQDKLYINLSEEDWNFLNKIVLDTIGVKSKGSSEIISEEFEREFRTGITYRLYPGCRKTLKQIKTKKIKLGLHTHASREVCQEKMKKWKILEFFDIFIHPREFGYNKSNIEIYQIALDSMGVKDPKKILHVGDDLDLDVKMAQKIGMIPVLFDPYNESSLDNVITITELPELLQYLEIQ